MNENHGEVESPGAHGESSDESPSSRTRVSISERRQAEGSDELRVPLRTISLDVRTLQSDACLTDIERMRGGQLLVERSAARMERSVDELVDAEHVRTGAIVLCRALARIDELIAEAWAMLRAAAVRKQLTVCIRAHRESALLSCDEDRVLWVLTNLLSNAIELTDEGGRVEVHSWLAGSEIGVSVHDTGRAVRDGGGAAALERFHYARGEDARGRRRGLDIVRSIVTAHGGEFRVESELSSGTCTTFTLPRRIELPSA